MKREWIIFFVIFLILTLGMHYKEWFSHPIEHLSNLPQSGAYGLGVFHPLIITLIVYIIVGIIRSIVRAVSKIKAIKKGS